MAGKVLLVDDTEFYQKAYKNKLLPEGYLVTTASNGVEALKCLSQEVPDVILLDLMMPVMDGWTFAKRLHETDDIPIVVLSAANDLERHAKAVGARDVVGKPFDLDQLLPKVARAAEPV